MPDFPKPESEPIIKRRPIRNAKKAVSPESSSAQESPCEDDEETPVASGKSESSEYDEPTES